MIFEQFCKQYRILPNLKEHLLDVAAITKIISDSWVGELPCDQEDIIVAALLHDIGSMAKIPNKNSFNTCLKMNSQI